MPPTLRRYQGPTVVSGAKFHPVSDATIAKGQYWAPSHIVGDNEYALRNDLSGGTIVMTYSRSPENLGGRSRPYLLRLPEFEAIKAAQPRARILGFWVQYVFNPIELLSGTYVKGYFAMAMHPVKVLANWEFGQAIGQEDGSHEWAPDASGYTFDNLRRNRVTQLYDPDGDGEYGASIFNIAYSGDLVNNFHLNDQQVGKTDLKFASELQGMVHYTHQFAAINAAWSVRMDVAAINITTYYIPQNPGITEFFIGVTSTPFSSQPASALGLTADPDWGSERPWTTPNGARSSRAGSETFASAVSTAQFQQTEFLVMEFAPGCGATAADAQPRELRIPFIAAVYPTNAISTTSVDLADQDWGTLAEVVLIASDGTVLAKYSDNPIYDLNNFHINSNYNGWRVYCACVDISGFTNAQFAKLNAGRFKVGLKFNLHSFASDHTGVEIRVWSTFVPGDLPSFSYGRPTGLVSRSDSQLRSHNRPRNRRLAAFLSEFPHIAG